MHQVAELIDRHSLAISMKILEHRSYNCRQSIRKVNPHIYKGCPDEASLEPRKPPHTMIHTIGNSCEDRQVLWQLWGKL
jgi:hypothetical protein